MTIQTGRSADFDDLTWLLIMSAGLVAAGVAAGWLLHGYRAAQLQPCSDDLDYMLHNAPIDDEDESPEEAAAVAVSLAEIDRGELIPWEQVRRRLRMPA